MSLPLAFATCSLLMFIVPVLCMSPTQQGGKGKPSFTVVGRCPSTCSTNVTRVFRECAPLLDNGCSMTFCPMGKNSTLSRVRCQPTGKQPQLYPDDQVKIDMLSASNPQNLTFAIDVSQSPIRLDVYLLVDATKTMNVILPSIAKHYGRLMDLLSTDMNVAFGVGIYRDETELEDGFLNMQRIIPSGSQPVILKKLRQIVAKGGGDVEEANLPALYQVATNETIGWRKNSRRIVLLVGDHVGHEPSCIPRFPVLDRKFLSKTLNDKDITVIPISYPKEALNRITKPYGDERCENKKPKHSLWGQASYIASRTGGVYMDDDTFAFQAERIVGEIRKLKYRVSVPTGSQMACSKLFKMSFNNVKPAAIMPDGMLKINMMTKPQGLCASTTENNGKKNGMMKKCTLPITLAGFKKGLFQLEFIFKNVNGCVTPS